MFDQIFQKIASQIEQNTSFPPLLFVWTNENLGQYVHELAQKLCNHFGVSSHQIHTFSQGETIKIGELREFFQSSFLRPGEKFSIFILENIDTATLQAFNSSLKVFEEPGEGNIIFLTAGQVGNIPETILSRVQIIEVKSDTISEKNSFFEDMIQKYMTQKDTEIFSYFFASKTIEKEEYVLFLDTLFMFWQENAFSPSLLEQIFQAKGNIVHGNASARYEVDCIFVYLEKYMIW